MTSPPQIPSGWQHPPQSLFLQLSSLHISLRFAYLQLLLFKLYRRLPQILSNNFHGTNPKANTILDGIAEFAKMPLSLNFCVRAMLRLWPFGVRLTQMRSQFLASLNGRPQKVDMSRRGQTRFKYIGMPPCCVLHTVAPAAARFLLTSIKADTKSLGRILCSGEQPKRHCLSFLHYTKNFLIKSVPI